MMKSPGFRPARNAGVSSMGRHDLDEPFFHSDLDAEAAELALGADLKLAERRPGRDKPSADRARSALPLIAS